MQRDVVHVDVAVHDPDRVAFLGDDALDEHLLRVERVVEHDDVAGPRLAELVDELVDDQPIVILERRRHAQAVDARDLEAERDDQRGVERPQKGASGSRPLLHARRDARCSRGAARPTSAGLIGSAVSGQKLLAVEHRGRIEANGHSNAGGVTGIGSSRRAVISPEGCPAWSAAPNRPYGSRSGYHAKPEEGSGWGVADRDHDVRARIIVIVRQFDTIDHQIAAAHLAHRSRCRRSSRCRSRRGGG